MIKDIIKDLANEEISLTKALTKTKIIAKSINNQILLNWLRDELNGYQNDLEFHLPDYRKFEVTIKADGIDALGRPVENINVDFTQIEKVLGTNMYLHYELQPINSIEKLINQHGGKGQFIVIQFNQNILSHFSYNNSGCKPTLLKKILSITRYENIIHQTRQRLLDILLDLDTEFPNLETEFQITKENEEKSSQIVHLHIYGDNNNTNLGVGNRVSQNNIEFNVKNFEDKLRSFNVPEDDITDAKKIISDNFIKDKGGKLLKWLGKLTTKAIEKGIEVKTPELIDYINSQI